MKLPNMYFFILTKSAVTLFSSCIFKPDLGLPTLHSNRTLPYQATISLTCHIKMKQTQKTERSKLAVNAVFFNAYLNLLL